MAKIQIIKMENLGYSPTLGIVIRAEETLKKQMVY